MKEKIKEFAFSLGIDDIGFTNVNDYKSPKSPEISSIFPKAKTIIVLAYKEPSSCESNNMQIAMSGRLDLMEFSRTCNYKMVRFLDKQFDSKAMSIPVSYPMQMSLETMGSVGELSLRHSAVLAGLGTFGRHNIVIHPKFGSRVVFTAILSDISIPKDTPLSESLCNNCLACVKNCPASALNDEGKTDVVKCLKNSQPYGIGGSIKFMTKFIDSDKETQKKMAKDVEFWKLYQAGFIGFQYFCWNCMKSCPVCQKTDS